MAKIRMYDLVYQLNGYNYTEGNLKDKTNKRKSNNFDEKCM